MEDTFNNKVFVDKTFFYCLLLNFTIKFRNIPITLEEPEK